MFARSLIIWRWSFPSTSACSRPYQLFQMSTPFGAYGRRQAASWGCVSFSSHICILGGLTQPSAGFCGGKPCDRCGPWRGGCRLLAFLTPTPDRARRRDEPLAQRGEVLFQLAGNLRRPQQDRRSPNHLPCRAASLELENIARDHATYRHCRLIRGAHRMVTHQLINECLEATSIPRPVMRRRASEKRSLGSSKAAPPRRCRSKTGR